MTLGITFPSQTRCNFNLLSPISQEEYPFVKLEVFLRIQKELQVIMISEDNLTNKFLKV